MSRDHLRGAIDRHRDAAANFERIEAALAKLDTEFFEVRQPAVRAALDAAHEAKRRHTSALVADALGEAPPEGLSVYGANKALAEAQRALDEAREARKLLTTANESARATYNLAKQALDRAIAEVVAVSGEVETLRAEFEHLRKRISVVIGALKAAGVRVSWPLALDDTAFANTDWESALQSLREDADAQLPGLPEVTAMATKAPSKRNGAGAGVLADL